MSEDARVEAVDQPPKPVGAGFFAIAAWLGLVVGTIEVGLLLFEMNRNYVATIGSLRLNRHYPWMVPASLLTIFAVVGVAFEVIRKIRPGLANRTAPVSLGALALLAMLLTMSSMDTLACVLLAAGIASQVVPRIKRFGMPFRRTVKRTLPFMLAGLMLLAVGLHVHFAIIERLAETKTTVKGSPNVLLLVLDTVRAKNLSVYGYPRETTPRLTRLAARGVGFTDARSAAPWTLPSHATMFTGRWPSELFEHPEQKFDPSSPTLAEYLGQNGYSTGGFVANTYYCNSGFGLGRGFDHYEDFYESLEITPFEILRHSGLGRRLVKLTGTEESARPVGRKDADRVNNDFLTWLGTKKGRPFFAFLNYTDAHAPYVLPVETNVHFGLRPTTPADFKLLAGWQKLSAAPTDPRQLELARDAYDDCIAYLDAAIGRLFDDLDKQGLLNNTLVVVTSDHGEEIGEHQLVGHGRSLYRDELHVPLLVVKPGRVPSGKMITEPVSLRDLPATIVDLLGLSDHSPFPGRSLAPLWTAEPGAGGLDSGVVRSEVALREKTSSNKERPPALRGPMTSVVAEGMSYIRNADGTEELYKLADDPAEAKNLAKTEAGRPILARLRSLAANKTDGPPGEVTASSGP